MWHGAIRPLHRSDAHLQTVSYRWIRSDRFDPWEIIDHKHVLFNDNSSHRRILWESWGDMTVDSTVWSEIESCTDLIKWIGLWKKNSCQYSKGDQTSKMGLKRLDWTHLQIAAPQIWVQQGGADLRMMAVRAASASIITLIATVWAFPLPHSPHNLIASQLIKISILCWLWYDHQRNVSEASLWSEQILASHWNCCCIESEDIECGYEVQRCCLNSERWWLWCGRNSLVWSATPLVAPGLRFAY